MNILDNINGYPLDKYQRKAVLCKKENVLVVAGAGSGKTLTIIGKIRYLIEELKINKEDILCISFTNDTVNSLKESLLKNYNYDIDVYTFHKLSLEIIRNNNKDISICESDLLAYIVDEFFYRNIKIRDKEIYLRLKNLIITFINLFKSNNYNLGKFDEIFNNLKYSNEYILLKIIKEIYIEYQEELNSTYKVDFNDMINEGINILKNKGYIKPYKYIIIDEYQDTSFTKYNLIKEIKKITNAKLFVVGDDFQSIYRFTGCNLDIFIKFKKYYKNSKILKIKNTYRNSQELINIAGSFIMKNKNQIKKKLLSNKRIDKPIRIIYTTNIKSTFKKLINKIDTDILVLGRNNSDMYKVMDSQTDKVKFLTVHKSKGLEEENVIIINLEDNILGFPSKIENHKILKYVLNEKDMYPYEEERRLFYVALTRTKNYVYLIVDKNNQSIFVKEIIKNNRKNIYFCEF
ncbi:MAG: UvrD-helicase domain-containing protein [Bacilli bacterium]|nr:UvrD-helicase domain-containing protein [Bacilli bacterium]MBO6195512.1 UvrD-helicase domain-containing protein [Bacilli bacterium]